MIDVTLDWETYFDSQYNIKKLGTMAYVRDPRFQILGASMKVEHEDTRWYTPNEIDVLVEELKSLEASNGVRLIGQNTKFDGLILAEKHNFIPSYYCDTMAMAKGLWPHHKSDLDSLTKRLFPNDKSKHKGTELESFKGKTYEDIEADGTEQILIQYGVQDSDITYESFKQMEQWYPKPEMDIIDMTVRMFCDPVFVLDTSLMDRVAVEATKEKESVIQTAIDFVNSDEIKARRLMINGELQAISPKTFSSNKEFPLLLESLGMDIPMKKSPTTGKQTPALGKNDVPYINLKRENHEFLPIFEARERAKSNQAVSRAKKLVQAVNGRPNNDNKLVVPLVYYGAHTGRYGGNEGLNLQNLQRGSEHRKALTAPFGQLVYVADSSNIEARIVAWFAQETALLNQFKNGIDTYATLATDIYGFPVTKQTHQLERNVGKVARLGLQYGMGARTFHRTMESGPMGIPPMPWAFPEIEKIVKTYRRTHPMIKKCWEIGNQIIQKMIRKDTLETWRCLTVRHQCLELPNGMYLQFPNLRNKEIQTAQGPQYEVVYDSYDYKSKKLVEKRLYGGKLLENIAQALAGLAMKEMMLDIQEDLRAYNGRVALQVHDEIIAVADGSTPDVVMQIMYDNMNTSPSWAPDLPLESEGGYDTCYSK